MKARPRPAVVLKITTAALAVMVPVAAFGVALDYNVGYTQIFGWNYFAPKGYTDCKIATLHMDASRWLQNMSNEFATQVNKISGYGSGSQKIYVADSSLYEVCNTSYSGKCQDQMFPGINSQYVGLLAVHGSSLPISTPNSPTFNASFSSYSTSNSIAGSDDCGPQMFGKMHLGLPSLKFLMILSCDSMNVASDLPSGSDQMRGWFANTWGVHVIAGFSGINHANATTTTMDSFIKDQKSQGIGHAWMNHFTYFDPTGNNTTVGGSDCAVPLMLGNNAADIASRWNETINSPNARSNPSHPTGAYQSGYWCNCCSDYGNNQASPGQITSVHCTPNC